MSVGVCMPIPPNVTFADLRAAANKDPRIIPFGGVDFTQAHDVEASLAADVHAGAKGLKLHPILQGAALTDRRTVEEVEAFAPHEFPILMHTGIANYYSEKADKIREKPSFGKIQYARDLIKSFPKVTFIVGHAGLAEIGEVLEMLSGFKNVWVDISFQNVLNARQLIETFGPGRVLYASDWPFGERNAPIRIVKKASRGDKTVEKRIFYENAAELLKISW